jgi:hypothetical protein
MATKIAELNPSASVTGVFNLATGDQITVAVSQTSGGAVPLTASASFNFVTIDRLV